jgi:mono/diheme cytochrome c family protein
MRGKSLASSGHRRETRGAAASLFACVGILAAIGLSCAASQEKTATKEVSLADRIARGRTITYSSGCVDCHTPGTFYGAPDTTRYLSGSELGWEGPWGVTFPRNLTPDTETGIGSWSEDQIMNAVRTGIRPDGTMLLPPMPWPAYSHMSDDDAHALVAYLKSLPPVHHKAPDRIPPGTKTNVARLIFPAPPAWDAQNLPKPSAPAKSGI